MDIDMTDLPTFLDADTSLLSDRGIVVSADTTRIYCGAVKFAVEAYSQGFNPQVISGFLELKGFVAQRCDWIACCFGVHWKSEARHRRSYKHLAYSYIDEEGPISEEAVNLYRAELKELIEFAEQHRVYHF